MNNGQRKLGYVAAFFAVWRMLALVFVSLSSATALGGRGRRGFSLRTGEFGTATAQIALLITCQASVPV